MAIFVAVKLAPHLLGPISVAAYSYMALMPMIQPPIMKLLTTKAERNIGMAELRQVSKLEKIAFPLIIAIIVNLFFPPVAPLITMLMLGNLLKEVGVTDRLAKTAAGGLMNVIIIILTVAIGSTMAADKFLTFQTLEIVVLGLVAFLFGTASGVVTAKNHESVPEDENQSPDRLAANRFRPDRRARFAPRGVQGESEEPLDLPRHGPKSRGCFRNRDLGRYPAGAAGAN